MVHALLEKNKVREDNVVEVRFQKEVKGVPITGKPDLIIPALKRIRDYKTCKEVPRYSNPYSAHSQQLGCYRWLIEGQVHNGQTLSVKDGEVVYIDMKQVKVCKVKKMPSLEEVEHFITDRVITLNEAIKNNTPPPVPEEYPNYWQCNGYCSVVKECSKLWQEDMKKECMKSLTEGKNDKPVKVHRGADKDI